jgi:hypothetical protein
MERDVHIDLDLQVDGEALAGRIRSGGGDDRLFTGWVELLAALDAALEEGPQP